MVYYDRKWEQQFSETSLVPTTWAERAVSLGPDQISCHVWKVFSGLPMLWLSQERGTVAVARRNKLKFSRGQSHLDEGRHSERLYMGPRNMNF